jgi:hypothetical protein
VPDLFADAAVWLDQQRRDYLSRTVTLRGADGVVVRLLAAIGSTDYETANDYGVIERWEAKDFVVSRADLPRLPMLGDVIVDENGGRVVTYEVNAPKGMPVWSPADSYSVSIAIHTTLVGG